MSQHDLTDALSASGLPIFFEVLDPTASGFAPPPNRHGQSVRVYARSLAGMQKEAVVVSALTGRAWRLASDEGPYLNGFDRAPCPLSFMTTGMVCSYLDEIRTRAADRGLVLRDLTLTLDNYYTMRGSALQGTMTGGALPVELSVQANYEAPRESLEELVREAILGAPVQPLLAGEQVSLFTATLNGAEIPVGRVRGMARSALPAASRRWPSAVALGARQENLIERLDAVDPHNAGPGGAGTSLAAEQDRRLHVRGVCRVGEDGAKEVQQFLFSPRGSVFRYRSDEARGFGGAGLAPDAATYMAAGIAFCFMTQLGRYAHIVKRRVDAYEVIQDIHFACGAGVRGSHVRGRIEPVETHVYLATPEDQDFARKVVDMGEQTCFLHAFCRTPLETKLKMSHD